jgi:hypothetical protein
MKVSKLFNLIAEGLNIHNNLLSKPLLSIQQIYKLKKMFFKNTYFFTLFSKYNKLEIRFYSTKTDLDLNASITPPISSDVNNTTLFKEYDEELDDFSLVTPNWIENNDIVIDLPIENDNISLKNKTRGVTEKSKALGKDSYLKREILKSSPERRNEEYYLWRAEVYSPSDLTTRVFFNYENSSKEIWLKIFDAFWTNTLMTKWAWKWPLSRYDLLFQIQLQHSGYDLPSPITLKELSEKKENISKVITFYVRDRKKVQNFVVDSFNDYFKTNKLCIIYISWRVYPLNLPQVSDFSSLPIRTFGKNIK